MKISKLKINLIAAMGLSVLAFTSCSKWLDVQPEDKFTKEQVYKNPVTVGETVNGFYLKMGTNNLYGSNLSMTILELLAQRYVYTNTTGSYINFINYSYDQTEPKATFSTIWTQMYATISNINDFIKELPLSNSGITPEQQNQYIAESIGLRAFLHFDLLRLFGPVNTEDNQSEPSIPYVRNLSTTIEPMLTTSEICQKILEDIQQAEELMGQGVAYVDAVESKEHFSIYALKALKARVYLWMGDRPNALAAAKEVIAVKEKFPWVTHQAITSNGSNPDRKFYSEVIFSVFNSKLYENQKNYFSSSLKDNEILSTGSNNYVNKVYEANEADYRFNYSWSVPATGVAFKTFFKYEDITNKEIRSRFMVPLIRLSEMYYIAAESTDDPQEALDYLNTVRQHRNINGDITDPSVLEKELTKEYMKEFYGEGQLWYYYKRKQFTSIFTVNNTDNILNIALSKYRIPYPEEEINGR